MDEAQIEDGKRGAKECNEDASHMQLGGCKPTMADKWVVQSHRSVRDIQGRNKLKRPKTSVGKNLRQMRAKKRVTRAKTLLKAEIAALEDKQKTTSTLPLPLKNTSDGDISISPRKSNAPRPQGVYLHSRTAVPSDSAGYLHPLCVRRLDSAQPPVLINNRDILRPSAQKKLRLQMEDLCFESFMAVLEREMGFRRETDGLFHYNVDWKDTDMRCITVGGWWHAAMRFDMGNGTRRVQFVVRELTDEERGERDARPME